MVKALVGVVALLALGAVLTVALVGNPFHSTARSGPTAQEFAAAARAQCGGKHAVPVCVRLVSERLRLEAADRR
jgi:hypothetical protein